MSELNKIKTVVISFKLYAPWVHSLKEKRMIVKSLIAKIQNKFHLSVAEIGKQDTHQIIAIGISGIVPDNIIADNMINEISEFIGLSTEAEVLEGEWEIR